MQAGLVFVSFGHLVHDKLDHIALHGATSDDHRLGPAQLPLDLVGFLDERVGLFHQWQDLPEALDVGIRQMDRQSVPRRPASCGALDDSRDEMRAQGIGRQLEATDRLESRGRHDPRRLCRHLDVCADVEDKLLVAPSAPLLAEVELRRHVRRSGRLRGQNLSGDLRVVDRRLLLLLEVVDNRSGNAPELLVPRLTLTDVVLSVQGFLDEVGKLGVTLLKLVRDECPLQAEVERRRQLRALRFAQTQLVELRAAIRLNKSW